MDLWEKPRHPSISLKLGFLIAAMDRNLLPALAAFVEVAREGSFTHAAARLGISPSALSQNVRALEERLDVRLLNRSTRSVSVTEVGRKLLAQIEPGLASITHAVAAIGDTRNRPAGEIRLNTSRVAARYFLEPHIGEFSRRYPAVRLEVIIDDGLGDIIGEGCDAGIRLHESVTDSMIAVPISPQMQMVVVGSPAYLAAHPAPETPHDLKQHNCVGYRHAGSGALYAWDFTDPATRQPFTVDPQGSYVTNHDDMMVSAALQGVGLVMHMEVVLRQHVAAGALIRVLDEWSAPFPGFDLYLPSRDQMPAKLRALVDFLVEKRGSRN
jgi:DNA-binding transcriptional LysR family regulator